MPNGAENAASAAASNASELSFENALGRLEAIVEAMQSDELPLETLLEKYAEGTMLAQACQNKLTAAELRIQELEKTSMGEFRLHPSQAQVASEQ